MDVAKGPAQVPGGPVCKRRELPTQHTGRSARNVFFGCAFGGQRASRDHYDEPDEPYGGSDDEKTVGICAGGRSHGSTTGLASQSAFSNDGTRRAASIFPEKLPLPPIPYLETMPWMNLDLETKRPRVDTLLPPIFVVSAFPKYSAFVNNHLFNTRQLLAGTGLK